MKKERNRGDLLSQLRIHLERFAREAEKLSHELGETGRPLTRPERRVVYQTIDGLLRDCMDEATLFVLNDSPEDLDSAIDHIKVWMQFKREF